MYMYYVYVYIMKVEYNYYNELYIPIVKLTAPLRKIR